jgi:hypothetical protein
MTKGAKTEETMGKGAMTKGATTEETMTKGAVTKETLKKRIMTKEQGKGLCQNENGKKVKDKRRMAIGSRTKGV